MPEQKENPESQQIDSTHVDEQYLDTGIFADLAMGVLNKRRSERSSVPWEVKQKSEENITEDSVVAKLHELRKQNMLKTEKDTFEAIARRELFEHLPEKKIRGYFYLGVFIKVLIDLLEEEKIRNRKIALGESVEPNEHTNEIPLLINNSRKILIAVQNGSTETPEKEDDSITIVKRLIATLKSALIRCKYLGKRLSKKNLDAFLKDKIGFDLVEHNNETQKEVFDKAMDLLRSVRDEYISAGQLEEVINCFCRIPEFKHVLPVGISEKALGLNDLQARMEIDALMMKQMSELEESQAPLKLNAISGVLENLRNQSEVILSEHDFLAENLFRNFFELIPPEVPQNLRKRLKLIMLKMLKVLAYIDYIQKNCVKENDRKHIRYKKTASPLYGQILTELRDILKEVYSKDESARPQAGDDDFDLEFDLSLEPGIELSIEDEIEGVLSSLNPKEDESGRGEDKNEFGFYIRVQEALFVIEQGIELALKNAEKDLKLSRGSKYGNDLGPELQAINGNIKNTLQRGIIHLAQLFDENVTMTAVFPEMKKDILDAKILRNKFVGFRKEISRIKPTFDELISGGKDDELMRRVLLDLYRQMFMIADQKDNLRFTERKVWLEIEAGLNEYLKSETHDDGDYKKITDQLKDFLSLFEQFPEVLNLRNVLADSDREHLRNACEAIKTARSLLESVELTEAEFKNAIEYLSLVLEEVKKCKDKDIEGMQYVIDRLYKIIKLYHSNPENIKADSHLHESVIDELSVFEKYLEGLFRS